MSTSDDLFRSYARRMGLALTAHQDGQFDYSLNVLREILQRLEVILEDEGVEPEKATRILRCLLYGAPSEADAEERIRTHQEMVKLMQAAPIRFLIKEQP